jgi:hypothetical protein
MSDSFSIGDGHFPSITKQRMWSPTSPTLIYDKRDAVPVDTFITVRQAVALAAWVATSGKNLTTIYITPDQRFRPVAEMTTAARELYDQMLELYPDRVNLGALWSSARDQGMIFQPPQIPRVGDFWGLAV